MYSGTSDAQCMHTLWSRWWCVGVGVEINNLRDHGGYLN